MVSALFPLFFVVLIKIREAIFWLHPIFGLFDRFFYSLLPRPGFARRSTWRFHMFRCTNCYIALLSGKRILESTSRRLLRL